MKNVYGQVEQNGLYVVCNGVALETDFSGSVSGSERPVSGTSSIDMVDLFKESKMKSFWALVQEVANENSENDSNFNAPLAFAESVYTLSGSIQTLKDVDLQKWCIRKFGEYTRWLG